MSVKWIKSFRCKTRQSQYSHCTQSSVYHLKIMLFLYVAHITWRWHSWTEKSQNAWSRSGNSLVLGGFFLQIQTPQVGYPLSSPRKIIFFTKCAIFVSIWDTGQNILITWLKWLLLMWPWSLAFVKNIYHFTRPALFCKLYASFELLTFCFKPRDALKFQVAEYIILIWWRRGSYIVIHRQIILRSIWITVCPNLTKKSIYVQLCHWKYSYICNNMHYCLCVI